MIKRYANAERILEDFYDLRLRHYHLRKEHLLEKLRQEWTKLENKTRFIKAIISGDLRVQNRKRCDIISDLRRFNYDPFPKTPKSDKDEHSEAEDSVPDGTDYDYLLSMQIYSLTVEKVAELVRQVEAKKTEIDQLLALSPIDLWNRDLDAFEALWRADIAKDEQYVEENTGSSRMGAKKVPKKKTALKKASDEAIVEVAATKKPFPNTKKPKVEQAKLIEAATTAAEPAQQPLVINLEDELMSLPLAERINRMLAYKPVVSLQPPPAAGSISASATSNAASTSNAFGKSLDANESISKSIFGKHATALKVAAVKKKTATAAAPRKKAGAATKPTVAMVAQKRPSDNAVFEGKDDSWTAGKDIDATTSMPTNRPARAVRKAAIVESDDDTYTMEVEEDEYSEGSIV